MSLGAWKIFAFYQATSLRRGMLVAKKWPGSCVLDWLRMMRPERALKVHFVATK
jgi:hypothetical protein